MFPGQDENHMNYNYTQPSMFYLESETHGGEEVTVYAR
jgi:hypothetical protein